jgi:SsrA-binding protein
MAAQKKAPAGEKVVCTNRKATHLYHIEETFEAGLMLVGTEVKSLRGGKGSIQESFAQVKNGEAWLHQFHIPHYEQGNIWNVDAVRTRKLLLHKKQVEKLAEATARKGYTLVPMKVYFKNGYAKVLLGLGLGKKLHDKREDLKKKDQQRDMQRAMRGSRKDF